MKKHEKIWLLTALLCVLAAALILGAAVPDTPVTLHAIGSPQGEKLNINTADAEALELLPGIGPVLADAILTRRAELGRFSSRDELLTAEGMGEARVSAIEPYITY